MDLESKAPKASEVVMGSAEAPSLLRFMLGTTKGHSCCQHSVENDQQLVRDCHYGALWPQPL